MVEPVFWSGDPSLVVDCRPVSLICSLSKVLEIFCTTAFILLLDTA